MIFTGTKKGGAMGNTKPGAGTLNSYFQGKKPGEKRGINEISGSENLIMQKSKMMPDNTRAGKMKIEPHGTNEGFGFLKSEAIDDDVSSDRLLPK
jgi:hypothetical protein